MKNRSDRRGNPPSGPSRAELQNRIDELEAENETLDDKLDSILDIASEGDDEEDEDDQD